MAKRSEELSESILWAAKNVFLEVGFERASMDEIAARTPTSKRTLYAHYESKENLYLAVVELVRDLFLSRLRMPDDYGEEPRQALVMFCGHFLEIVLFGPSIQMSRMSIAEASRFPEGSVRYFDAGFSAAHTRLSDYLSRTFELSKEASSEAAQRLLGRVLHPRFLRALFGVDEPSERLGEETIHADFDLEPIRRAVAELMASL